MIDYLKSKANINLQSVEVLRSFIKTTARLKGELLFEQGKLCDRIFFIKEGFARIYYISEDGKDITELFVPQKNYSTPMSSFIPGEISQVSCELLEDSIVSELTQKDLNVLVNYDHELSKVAFSALREITSLTIQLIRNLKFLSAKEKYDALIAQTPNIFQRVPAVHIASYLGTTPETLSRIRAEKE
ncbi:MAG: Crp/Fnr family transcriptional regulator [Mangrovibacterium sp.]